MPVTNEQKQWVHTRLSGLMNWLRQFISLRDNEGRVIAGSPLFPCLRPELGIKKDWKAFLRLAEEGRKAFEEGVEKHPMSSLAYPDCGMCITFKYQCEFWRGLPQFGGEGEYYNRCPEFLIGKTIIGYCYADPRASPPHPQANEHVYPRAEVRRRCSERLATLMLEKGETAPYQLDMTRYCKRICHRYKECASPEIPKYVAERYPKSPFYDSEYAGTSYKTLYDQWCICQLVDDELNILDIEIEQKMLKLLDEQT